MTRIVAIRKPTEFNDFKHFGGHAKLWTQNKVIDRIEEFSSFPKQ